MGARLPIANRKSTINHRLWLPALAVALAAGEWLAAAPRLDADPNKDYRITPEVGPYVVCAAAYKGKTAEGLAKQLILQVRQRDNLPAYYFNFGEKERREMEEHLNKVREFSPPDARIRTVRIEDHYAVLIGGYSDMDSARRALDTVKRLKMPDFKVGPGMEPFERTIDPQTGRVYAISPFAHAFVSRNPAIPQNQQPQEKQDDPFLKELNAGEEYSLLQCKKPFTLAVKEYAGVTNLQPRSGASGFLEKIGLGRKSSDMLSASALQAHELARVLREHLGLEAYVLHDRRCSYVTVGGYDRLNNEEMQRMQQRLASLSFRPTGGGPAPSMEVLQLNVPAKPMRVPRP